MLAAMRFAIAMLLGGTVALSASAQITLDGTVGPKGALEGPHYTIGADLGTQRGGNLFHSFGDFNIRSDESATFTGPNSIDNVIGRVTGGRPSSINGRLACDIPGADLYLINPAGVMFGSDATLDVKGSFNVTTADYLGLADGTRFDASRPSSLLSAAQPQAFGFLGRPAGITFEGSDTEVPEGKTFRIVGGTIKIAGATLSAPSGRIDLASVGSEAEVVPGAGLGPDAISISSENGGTVSVVDGAVIKTTGDGGGAIAIRAANLDVDNALIAAETTGGTDGGGIDIRVKTLRLLEGGVVTTDTYGSGDGGSVDVVASDSTEIDGEDNEAFDSGIFADTEAKDRGAGRAGTIRLVTRDLKLSAGGMLTSDSSGPGHGGSVEVNASGSIRITGEDSEAFVSGISADSNVSSGKAGDAGSVSIVGSSLELSGGGRISSTSLGSGDGGSVAVTVPGSIEITGEASDGHVSGVFANSQGEMTGAGDGGSIKISAGKLELTAGGSVAGISFGPGDGAALEVSTAESIEISGEDRGVPGKRDPEPSGIISEASGAMAGAGNAGPIKISTSELRVFDGGVIDSTTRGPGNGGSIEVVASESIEISGNSVQGGSRGILAVTQGEADDAGDAGTIDVFTSRMTLSRGGLITSTTFGPGNGGSIHVDAADSIEISGDFRGNPSGIVASSQPLSPQSTGEGLAGDVRVVARRIDLNDGSIISVSSASSVEPGGSVVLHADRIFRARNSSVTADAAAGEGGDVSITSPDIQLLDGSEVTARAAENGSGGNVTLKGETVVAAGDSDLSARAVGGPGGNITVSGQAFFRCPECEVDVSSQFSEQGTVLINSPDTNLAGVLARLPESLLRVDDLLSRTCARGAESSFVVRGADGVPLAPEGEAD